MSLFLHQSALFASAWIVLLLSTAVTTSETPTDPCAQYSSSCGRCAAQPTCGFCHPTGECASVTSRLAAACSGSVLWAATSSDCSTIQEVALGGRIALPGTRWRTVFASTAGYSAFRAALLHDLSEHFPSATVALRRLEAADTEAVIDFSVTTWHLEASSAILRQLEKDTPALPLTQSVYEMYGSVTAAAAKLKARPMALTHGAAIAEDHDDGHHDDGHHCHGGCIAGIVVGLIVLILIICGVVFLVRKFMTRSHTTAPH